MSRTTLIDRDSAEKALAALNGEDAISGEALKSVLATVLTRKLGRTAPVLATGDRMPDKFERFFDILFDVAIERKPMKIERVLELAVDVAANLRTRAREERETGDMDDLASMYDADAADYDEMITHLKAGDMKRAVDVYRHMDSAPRDRLFGRNKREEVELAVFLDENGY